MPILKFEYVNTLVHLVQQYVKKASRNIGSLDFKLSLKYTITYPHSHLQSCTLLFSVDVQFFSRFMFNSIQKYSQARFLKAKLLHCFFCTTTAVNIKLTIKHM